MPFTLDVAVNPLGWGPLMAPEEQGAVPFLPFGRNDKLNRIADWTTPTHQGRAGEEALSLSFADQF